MTTPEQTDEPRLPGSKLNPEKMPGHWILAKMGKRVLRPGGRGLTELVLEQLRIGPGDEVVELAPGLGATARLLLAANPKSYTAVERDPDAAEAVRQLLRPTDRVVDGVAQHTGLEANSADIVIGEAFITMQSQENKEAIVAEAFRILRPGGRYGIHELSLRPDGIAADARAEVVGDLQHTIRVGARPITNHEWRELLENAGFEIRSEFGRPMHLLNPKRLVDDEGWQRSLKIAANVLRDRTARRRILDMRSTFVEHEDNLGAVGIVAVKPA